MEPRKQSWAYPRDLGQDGGQEAAAGGSHTKGSLGWAESALLLPVFHALPYHKDSESLENFVCEELGLRLIKALLLVPTRVSHGSGLREAAMQAVQPRAQLPPARCGRPCYQGGSASGRAAAGGTAHPLLRQTEQFPDELAESSGERQPACQSHCSQTRRSFPSL